MKASRIRTSRQSGLALRCVMACGMALCARAATAQGVAAPGQAQTPVGVQTSPRPTSSGARLRIDERNGEVLFALEQQRGVKAVELDVTQAQLRQSPAAWRALSRWVARGGVVILHSDAAQLFGFETVTARPRTRARAGQEFGRSRASLPFGAHPLLWGGVSQTLEGQTRGTLGVHLVYYQLQEGDQLAVAHGAGVPLLSVTDLSAAPRKEKEVPLYAAMMAPYGQGWAMVLPRTIEARADGATFARNLDRFIAALPPVATSVATSAVTPAGGQAWTSVSARAIETAYSQVQGRGKTQWGELARACREALVPWPESELPASELPKAQVPRADAAIEDETLAANAPVPTAPRLLMRRDEAAALAREFGRAEAGEEMGEEAEAGDEAQAQDLVRQLQARLALQRGQAPGSQVPDVAEAQGRLALLLRLDAEARKRLAPTVPPEEKAAPDALVLQRQMWNGILAASAASAFGANAPGRAAAWREAIQWWNLALGQGLEEVKFDPSFDESKPPAPLPLADKSERWLGSVPLDLVREWQHHARWAFQSAAHQPMMVLIWRGPHSEQNAITMYPVDAALPGLPTPIKGNEYPISNSFRWRLIQRTIGLLDSGVRDYMGWGADQVEMRLTPEPWFFTDYGGGTMAWDTLGDDSESNLKGSRILLRSSPAHLPDTLTGINVPRLRFTYVEHNPADPYAVDYTKKSLQKELREELDEIAKDDAIRKVSSTQEVINEKLQAVRQDYDFFLMHQFKFQELRAQPTPFYLAHLHRNLLTQALTQGGSPVPKWMQEGLANVACLSLSGNIQLHGIYPALPANLQHDHPFPDGHLDWQNRVMRATASYAPQFNFRKRKLNKLPDYILYGPSLIHQDSTRQLQFFYEEFGRGAVVETLQRLGSGQSIDEALQGTTGLNQAQFFAAWQRWNAQPPAAPARPDAQTPDAAGAAPANPTEAEALKEAQPSL